MKILKHKTTVDTIARISLCLNTLPRFELPKSKRNCVVWRDDGVDFTDVIYDEDCRVIFCDPALLDTFKLRSLTAIADKYDLEIREDDGTYEFEKSLEYEDEEEIEVRQLH